MAFLDERNNLGRTPLLAGVFNNCEMDIIKYLIRAGSSVQVADNEGYTVLHLELISPKPTLEVIDYLLSRGANGDARDNNNLPPLAYVENSNLQPDQKQTAAEILIKHIVLVKMFQMPDGSPDEILNLNFCKVDAKRNDWISFRDACIGEIREMKNKGVTENITVLDLVIDYVTGRCELKFDNQQSTGNNLLFLMMDSKYSVYNGVIVNSVNKYCNLPL